MLGDFTGKDGMENNGIDWSDEAANLVQLMEEDDREKARFNAEQIYKDQGKVRIEKTDFFRTLPDVMKLYKNCIKMNFEKNFASVSKIEKIPFDRESFLVGCVDGSLRIYSCSFLTSKSKYIR